MVNTRGLRAGVPHRRLLPDIGGETSFVPDAEQCMALQRSTAVTPGRLSKNTTLPVGGRKAGERAVTVAAQAQRLVRPPHALKQAAQPAEKVQACHETQVAKGRGVS